MGYRQSVETLQWLEYIGRTRNVSHAGNEREVLLAGAPNVKVEGYCEETNEVFEYLWCFWHGCLCMPNRHIPIGKTEETLVKLRRGCRKSKTLVIRLFRSGGVSLENC